MAPIEPSLLSKINKFKTHFSGDFYTDDAMRIIYSSDASLYEMLPLAVAYPKDDKDLRNLILFANKNELALIPRTAGTSLGGQCVGTGIIVDVSRYMNQILEINPEEKWAIVQPGVIRDELNLALSTYNLHFGPNTSTSNRAMIGGMVGNNSSGSYSIKYGTTRENILEIKGFLSDSSEATFGELSVEEFRKKSHGTTLESAIYRQISFELSHPVAQEEIEKQFPKKTVSRRNTGYAVDYLLDTEPFYKSDKPFNFSKLLCGSEGTLMLFSQIKVKLVDKPTTNHSLICYHFDSLEKSLLGAVEAMKLSPNQCELMDKIILDCTKDNILQRQNRFFIQGDPAAILMIEVEEKPNSSLSEEIEKMNYALESSGLTYAKSILYGDDIKKALQLRASGLGVLQNVKGDEKPLEFVEDTAVSIEDLPSYIHEFDEMIRSFGTSSVFYAHAGAGELHTRPKVNLKTEEGRKLFRAIGEQSAHLVKKYQGSLSGEHGDGLVRAEFIPIVLGVRNYELFKRIKKTWDPNHIFNPNKIVDAFPMDSHLKDTNPYIYTETLSNFEKEGSILHAVEKCSGSGDCRKTEKIGGTLCPSYQATREEKYSTRARANMLKSFLVHSDKMNKFDQIELYETLKLCLSCKACVSECPSSVDMASIKSEFLFQYQKSHPASFIQKSMAHFYETSQKIRPFSFVVNAVNGINLFSWIPKKIMGVHSGRSLPKYHFNTVEKWIKNYKKTQDTQSKAYLWVDEFTNYLDAKLGIQAILLLEKLGIEVEVLPFMDSARSLISKGFLEEAKKKINQNIDTLASYLKGEIPILGIEPSTILGIRDDYFRYVDADKKMTLEQIRNKTFLIDEFLDTYLAEHLELKELFTDASRELLFHGHCHQKSLSHSKHSLSILNFPKNYQAKEIPSGCCGMAGSFGYENFELSMKVGEMVLFPSVRNSKAETMIVATGTSCRHQIKDGTKRSSWHPVEVLYEALK